MDKNDEGFLTQTTLQLRFIPAVLDIDKSETNIKADGI